ncbi:hypothetical protein [Bradyrhizobium sp. AUGA SZCCT0160]|uniref:hypothetical protein n=1 Tax=Bradyrhizobium sp. AUGA SZCCT0160 TaxID=2807662 RepID=UPI001BA4DC29|nr:hypothetical protein [Bradyrhizobium sp. AUGA SZCCT0160]MBR1188545.1 hypothetical protein [Bradyrhizobium sp. AUGA SZCCT0160]
MTKGTKPARSKRVEARPDPRSWEMDELMTLKEAVELHWPDGLITVPTLRTSIRQGRLAVCEIAGKYFLTRRLLLALSTGQILDPSPEAVRPRRGGGMSAAEARAIAGLPPQ